ncbi:unnamed protein product [Lupinus luteus]|uniref:Vignain n=1 Tax=Lupinus luteus TaxID=3873 RepID=A0AAV1XFX1_LUPLU
MGMKKLLWVALSLTFVFAIAESFDLHENDLASDESLWDLYERWRSHHTVSQSLDEKHKRFNVFKTNVMHVHNTNKMDKPYKLKLNKFADMTNHEFRSSYAGSKINHHIMFRDMSNGNGSFMYEKFDVVPTSIDWRKKGAVTHMKNLVVSIDGHEKVPANNEEALLKAVANQPISVAIDAGGTDFQFYSEGVFTGECGTDLNHGVAIVGYGKTLDGTKYWIVRNSWGPEWGEQGYIRMQRGISDKKGLCGIAMLASYPIKTSSTNPTTGNSSSLKDEL